HHPAGAVHLDERFPLHQVVLRAPFDLLLRELVEHGAQPLGDRIEAEGEREAPDGAHATGAVLDRASVRLHVGIKPLVDVLVGRRVAEDPSHLLQDAAFEQGDGLPRRPVDPVESLATTLAAGPPALHVGIEPKVAYTGDRLSPPALVEGATNAEENLLAGPAEADEQGRIDVLLLRHGTLLLKRRSGAR